jgi:hypothetical protein
LDKHLDYIEDKVDIVGLVEIVDYIDSGMVDLALDMDMDMVDFVGKAEEHSLALMMIKRSLRKMIVSVELLYLNFH